MALTLPGALGTAANVLQTWLAGAVIDHLKSTPLQSSPIKRTMAFILVALIAANGLAATVQSIASHAESTTDQMRSEFAALFISNALGVLALTPVMTIWMESWVDRHRGIVRERWPEIAFLVVLLVVSTVWVYRLTPDREGITPPYFYLVVPLLFWAVMRFGGRGASLGFLIYCVLALLLTSRGDGPFNVAGVDTETALLRLQEYLIVLGATVMFTSAIFRQNQMLLRVKSDEERRMAAVLSAGSSLMFEIDPERRSIAWTGNTAKILGIAQANIASTSSWTERVHPADRAYLVAQRDRLRREEVPSLDLEYRVRRDDGQYVPLGVNAFVHKERGADGIRSELRIVGFVKDITEQQRAAAERETLEAELRQAQKMEAIGSLAGGIAHDFNNILTAIIGYGERARAKAGNDSKLAGYLDTVLRAGERGRQLTAQILTFSRKRQSAKERVDVDGLIIEIADLLRGSTDVPIILELADGGVVVDGVPTELHQLVMNLATNGLHAMKAMPTASDAVPLTLTLSVNRMVLTALTAVSHGSLQPGNYARIAVIDQGAGIDAATQQRMFDPFFTTKGIGYGTGLGLSLALSIARAHSGGIRLLSTPGKGSTFEVLIPLAAGEQVREAAKPVLPMGNGQCIAVVDDEPELSELAAAELRALGYQPVVFSTATEVEAAIADDASRFAAVWSDEVMPDMTGTQLAARLRASGWQKPIFIVTGFGGAGFEALAQAVGVDRVLRKPFERERAAMALASLLGTSSVA
jgi:PAS domain S-box-containing protein